ncbi:MAG: hypothetical protein F9K18_12855 [Thermoanaerobaculia bacterium]|nr:MAG: hypothetical protein F9K18_12855 [Thermoanaerobaculia bacterium]
MSSRKKTLLADVERALLEALSESPAVQRTLWKLQREGWTLRLHLDCAHDSEADSEAGAEPPAAAPAARSRGRDADAEFRIDASDLRFLRSIGIDPTRKRRARGAR